MFTRTIRLPKRSLLLLGPRQTGKSTLVRSLLPKNAWVVDLLENDAYQRYLRDPSLFRAEAIEKIRGGVTVICVDEVQKIPALLDEIHGLIEKQKVRFILTGSSARKLKKSGTNLLAGRATVRRLHPLTIAEMGDAFDLERTLRFGSLPAVVSAVDDAERIEILRAYAATYLREEIQAEALVRNLGGFGRFLDVAASQSGDILNFSAVGRDAAVAVRSVQEYFQILEDTLVGFRLEAWQKSPRARLVAHPRFFLFDNGVTNAINRRLTEAPDAMLRGRLFEMWVILESQRMIENADSEARLFYWRTNHGAEVDLLVEKHGKIVLAVEIKSKPRVAGAELTGLRSFIDAHPKTESVVCATAKDAYRAGDVLVLPYREFFDRLATVL